MPSKTSRKNQKSGKTPGRKPNVIVLSITPHAGNKAPEYRQQRYEELSLAAVVEGGGAEFILQRPNHPYYMQMLQFVTERAWGKVPQEVNNRIGPLPAIALPPKDPEQIPEAHVEELPAPAAVAGLLLPPKDDSRTSDSLEPARGSADNLPGSE